MANDKAAFDRPTPVNEQKAYSSAAAAAYSCDAPRYTNPSNETASSSLPCLELVNSGATSINTDSPAQISSDTPAQFSQESQAGIILGNELVNHGDLSRGMNNIAEITSDPADAPEVAKKINQTLQTYGFPEGYHLSGDSDGNFTLHDGAGTTLATSQAIEPASPESQAGIILGNELVNHGDLSRGMNNIADLTSDPADAPEVAKKINQTLQTYGFPEGYHLSGNSDGKYTLQDGTGKALAGSQVIDQTSSLSSADSGAASTNSDAQTPHWQESQAGTILGNDLVNHGDLNQAMNNIAAITSSPENAPQTAKLINQTLQTYGFSQGYYVSGGSDGKLSLHDASGKTLASSQATGALNGREATGALNGGENTSAPNQQSDQS